jgi:hypothetical protein
LAFIDWTGRYVWDGFVDDVYDDEYGYVI